MDSVQFNLLKNTCVKTGRRERGSKKDHLENDARGGGAIKTAARYFLEAKGKTLDRVSLGSPKEEMPFEIFGETFAWTFRDYKECNYTYYY